MSYFLKKMILAKTYCKIHNTELLAIVTAFKTWKHYLEEYKYEIVVLIDYHNFFWFMDMKNLSFK